MQDDEAVVKNPDILGGEACLRGIRVPAYIVAEMREAGTPIEDMLRSYPSLTPELLEKACIYATAHPRRRFAEPIWRKAEPIETLSVPKQNIRS